MDKNKGTHGRFKLLRGETFEGHQLYEIVKITIDGLKIYQNKDYKIGSKVYKDYNAGCSKGHYKMKVVEY